MGNRDDGTRNCCETKLEITTPQRGIFTEKMRNRDGETQNKGKSRRRKSQKAGSRDAGAPNKPGNRDAGATNREIATPEPDKLGNHHGENEVWNHDGNNTKLGIATEKTNIEKGEISAEEATF